MTESNMRPLVKLASGGEMLGESERRTGAYESVREDSSTESTKQLTPELEFCKRSIINGRQIAAEIRLTLAKRIDFIKNKYNLSPSLAIIVVGADNVASNIYVKNKLREAEKIGIKAIKISFPENVNNNLLLNEIQKLNNDKEISGIIIQLPLPQHIDKESILSSIEPSKDVDGFHPINVGYLHSNINTGFIPCTALGCLALINKYEPSLSGKNVVVIGRSNIVGKPLASLLIRENCTVTICHSKTKNLQQITSEADIVISAIGSPNLLTKEYFNKNTIVIDVGISRLNQEIVGDVNFGDVHNHVKYITPVPGGVGPMTIAFLLSNTLKAFLRQHDISE